MVHLRTRGIPKRVVHAHRCSPRGWGWGWAAADWRDDDEDEEAEWGGAGEQAWVRPDFMDDDDDDDEDWDEEDEDEWDEEDEGPKGWVTAPPTVAAGSAAPVGGAPDTLMSAVFQAMANLDDDEEEEEDRRPSPLQQAESGVEKRRAKGGQSGGSGEDYSGMNVKDLKAAAKARGIKGFSTLKKAELLQMLGKLDSWIAG
jgi:hypothetical protein